MKLEYVPVARIRKADWYRAGHLAVFRFSKMAFDRNLTLYPNHTTPQDGFRGWFRRYVYVEYLANSASVPVSSKLTSFTCAHISIRKC